MEPADEFVSDVRTLIAAYCVRWWPLFAQNASAVASPSGAWLLCGLAAGAARPASNEATAAAGLVAHPPRAVQLATALWVAHDQRTADLQRWQASLPESVATGEIPTQSQADDWASQATGGVIASFPVSITEHTALVLANALASDVRWRRPYGVATSADWALGGVWAGCVQSILIGEDLTAVRTDDGLFAVHQAQADGLTVVCITGPTGEQPMATAADVFHRYLAGESEDLWSLPLGEHGCWNFAEEPLQDAPTAQVLRTQVRLPAWEVESTWDLMGQPELGFTQAADAIAALLANPGPAQATQRVRARFDRLGFTAAALTALAIKRSALPRDSESVTGVLRTIRADFAEPFAAFAMVDEADSAWHQVVAFAAWVHEPVEPHDEGLGR
ncbi:MAG: hypothetical protein ACKN9D_11525 [Actinomycetales bacterium]